VATVSKGILNAFLTVSDIDSSAELTYGVDSLLTKTISPTATSGASNWT
jgi:hypothetical protein